MGCSGLPAAGEAVFAFDAFSSEGSSTFASVVTASAAVDSVMLGLTGPVIAGCLPTGCLPAPSNLRRGCRVRRERGETTGASGEASAPLKLSSTAAAGRSGWAVVWGSVVLKKSSSSLRMIISTDGLKVCELSLTRNSDCAVMKAFSPPKRFRNTLAKSKQRVIRWLVQNDKSSMISRNDNRESVCMYVVLACNPNDSVQLLPDLSNRKGTVMQEYLSYQIHDGLCIQLL